MSQARRHTGFAYCLVQTGDLVLGRRILDGRSAKGTSVCSSHIQRALTGHLFRHGSARPNG
jgi:hypothetical protein